MENCIWKLPVHHHGLSSCPVLITRIKTVPFWKYTTRKEAVITSTKRLNSNYAADEALRIQLNTIKKIQEKTSKFCWTLPIVWSMKMAVFWAVAPCSLVEVYQRFRGPCCLHHQGDYCLKYIWCTLHDVSRGLCTPVFTWLGIIILTDLLLLSLFLILMATVAIEPGPVESTITIVCDRSGVPRSRLLTIKQWPTRRCSNEKVEWMGMRPLEVVLLTSQWVVPENISVSKPRCPTKSELLHSWSDTCHLGRRDAAAPGGVTVHKQIRNKKITMKLLVIKWKSKVLEAGASKTFYFVTKWEEVPRSSDADM
jgi:hypothetical protein